MCVTGWGMVYLVKIAGKIVYLLTDLPCTVGVRDHLHAFGQQTFLDSWLSLWSLDGQDIYNSTAINPNFVSDQFLSSVAESCRNRKMKTSLINHHCLHITVKSKH